MKNQEKRVCNAVARFIAERKGLTVNDIHYPDEEKTDNLPSIDVLIETSSLEIVMEHTFIESYPGQIDDHRRIWKLLKPLETMLTGELPTPGYYDLSIDVGAVKGAKDTKDIQNALLKWIKEKAPLLKIGSPETAPDHYIREQPDGVPFEVTLYRFPDFDGEFRLSQPVPEDLKEKRKQRIRKALEGKCPKLCKARGNNRISILLLEFNLFFLGNFGGTAEAIREELPLRNDVPDEIYLIDTALEKWRVKVLKERDSSFRDVKNPGPFYLSPRC